MKKIVFLLVAMISILSAEKLDRTGPYIAVGGGYATFYDDGRFENNMENSYNVNLIGGVFINKYLSVELAIDYYDTFSNAVGDTTNIYFFDAAAKAHYPFWRNRIDLYASFGAGGMKWRETLSGVSQKDNSGAVRGDIGVGVRAIDWLTFNVGYRRYFFTLQHHTGTTDTSGNTIYNTYNMELGSAYANIEVQF